MKVYSDKLETADLRQAAREAGVSLWDCEPMPRPRVRSKGWLVSLSGSSPYRSQTPDYHQAATYDEHGEWMARLFEIDPDARISWWKGAEDFHTRTENRYALATV